MDTLSTHDFAIELFKAFWYILATAVLIWVPTIINRIRRVNGKLLGNRRTRRNRNPHTA